MQRKIIEICDKILKFAQPKFSEDGRLCFFIACSTLDDLIEHDFQINHTALLVSRLGDCKTIFPKLLSSITIYQSNDFIYFENSEIPLSLFKTIMVTDTYILKTVEVEFKQFKRTSGFNSENALIALEDMILFRRQCLMLNRPLGDNLDHLRASQDTSRCSVGSLGWLLNLAQPIVVPGRPKEHIIDCRSLSTLPCIDPTSQYVLKLQRLMETRTSLFPGYLQTESVYGSGNVIHITNLKMPFELFKVIILSNFHVLKREVRSIEKELSTWSRITKRTPPTIRDRRSKRKRSELEAPNNPCQNGRASSTQTAAASEPPPHCALDVMDAISQTIQYNLTPTRGSFSFFDPPSPERQQEAMASLLAYERGKLG